MLPKKEIKNGLDDILKAVTETHRRGYNQPPTGYNQVNQPQPQGGELQAGGSLWLVKTPPAHRKSSGSQCLRD